MTLQPLVEEFDTRELKEIHSYLMRAKMYADDANNHIERELGWTNTYWNDTRKAQQRLNSVLKTFSDEIERREGDQS